MLARYSEKVSTFVDTSRRVGWRTAKVALDAGQSVTHRGRSAVYLQHRVFRDPISFGWRAELNWRYADHDPRSARNTQTSGVLVAGSEAEAAQLAFKHVGFEIAL